MTDPKSRHVRRDAERVREPQPFEISGDSVTASPVCLLRWQKRMVFTSPVSPPSHNIVQTDRGWVLIIQDEHCSVMQVFSTAASARRAVERMLEFFHLMSAQAPRARNVA